MLISGYSQYVVKNRKTRGGGVMIQLQNGYNIINQINSDFDGALFVDVIKNGTLIKLVVIYNPPRTNKLEFLNKLDSFLEENNNHNHPIVICGDLNIDIMKTNLVSKNYQNTIIANGFESLISLKSLSHSNNQKFFHIIGPLHIPQCSQSRHRNFAFY